MSNYQEKKKSVPIQSNDKNLQQEEKLTAVVLLDSYSESFKPLSTKKAECLLPLHAGRTFLDLNIEYLVENDVEEIFLFCTYNNQQIKAYLDERKWPKKVELHFLYGLTCRSLGDAMREIDAKGLVRTNFVLLTAPAVISNIKLREYLDLHAVTSKSDKSSIMTMLCESRMNDLSTNFNLSDISVTDQTNKLIIHNNTNRVLYYDWIGNDKKSNKYITIPSNLIESAYSSKQTKNQVAQDENTRVNQAPQFYRNKVSGIQGKNIESIKHLKTIQHRNDLIETQIYLCSPYVLHLFTDNFDNQTMTDFIRSVLVDEEVSGYTIYIDILKRKFNTYFALINNLNSYYLESMRLSSRLDLLLDENKLSNYYRSIDKPNLYINNSVRFGNNVKIDRNVFIDSDTRIGDNCYLINCIIGSNCDIGKNTKISNSIIWSNTNIGNNCILNASLLAYNVKIGNNCNLIENTLLSTDCHMKDNSNFLERGVFIKKEALNKNEKKSLEYDEFSIVTDLTFRVNEDNFVKYYLNSKSVETDENQDDNFDSDDSENDVDDNDSDTSSIASSINEKLKEQNDTSKNSHFLIWRIKSKKNYKIQNKLLRHSDFESQNESEENFSEFSETSSSGDELGDREYYAKDSYLKDDMEDDHHFTSKKSNLASSVESLKSIGSNKTNEENTFYNETLDIIKRGIKANLNPDNIILEINSCKHANNVVIDDLCYYLVKAIFILPLILNSKTNHDSNANSFDYFNLVKEQTKKLNLLFKNYYTKTKKSQKIFLTALLDFFIESKNTNVRNNSTKIDLLESYYVKVIHYLYNDANFLSEEVIIDWFKEENKSLSNNKTDDRKLLGLNKLEPFIKWLEEAEEEDEDDED